MLAVTRRMVGLVIVAAAAIPVRGVAAEPPRPGDVTENSIGMKLVVIPAGAFEMGSDECGDEKPIHTVRITKPFLMGQTEVTQAQWQAVMRQTPWHGNLCVMEGPTVAATYVDWGDAMAFCDKLTESERLAGTLPAGRSYRLPTEAEWEYACRAGTKTRFSFGDDESQLGDRAWWGRSDGGNTEKKPWAHAVGLKQPNAWQLFDMHGNVWEWCGDWYAADYYATSPAADPKGPDAGVHRVVRGGSWTSDSEYCRSAYREGDVFVGTADYYIGFRVVCELE